MTSTGATLYIGCSGLNLPSLIPDAIAAEAALRFTHVQYRVVRSTVDLAVPSSAASVSAISVMDPDYRKWSTTAAVPILATPSGGIVVGAESIITAASAYNSGSRHVGLDEGLSSAQLAVSAAVTALIKSTIFPAFEYALYGDDASFDQVRPTLHAALGLWDRLLHPVPIRRAAILQRLRSAWHTADVAEAVVLARRGLAALERLLAEHTRNSSLGTEDLFFLGTPSPASVDAFVFAAVSLAAASRFHRSSPWTRMQIEAGLTLDNPDVPDRQYPLLCSYGRRVAKRYYEQYEGLHFLNLPPLKLQTDADAAAEIYSGGRALTIIGTAIFALAYVVVANAQLILEILEASAADGAGEEIDEGTEAVPEQQQ